MELLGFTLALAILTASAVSFALRLWRRRQDEQRVRVLVAALRHMDAGAELTACGGPRR